jgi:DNA-binding response OmpR family regulator
MNLNYTVLAVDDEASVLKIVRMILERAGFDVLTASGPEEGFKVLKDNEVDVILLDVNMPIMSGFDMLAEIKSNRKHKDLPVIMVTCQSEIADFELGKTLGVMDYIPKPFDSRVLVQRVNRAIIYASRSDEFVQGTGKELLEKGMSEHALKKTPGGAGAKKEANK